MQRQKIKGVWRFECRDKNGNLKWVEEYENLIVNEGLDDQLDKYFKGSNYTAAHYVGLIDTLNNIAAGDTAAKITTGVPNAPTTNDWSENTDYTEATRPAFTPGNVSGQSVDNSASKATFSINATATITGGFVITNNTKGGTTGVLLSVGQFGSSKNVSNGDTLSVQITYTNADDGV